ncbi:MAG: hypothetical protein HYX41_00835 [Bdellovibrio sp.]|nr:hypothetical protein [Bdellovibrio sp.]
MPRVEAKAIHRELESGTLWPVYWLYGSEKLKARELFVRIRNACFQSSDARALSFGGLNEEVLDADQVDCASIVDSAQTLTLGGGLRLITIRDAHLLKNQEALAPLLGPPASRSDLASVCVFFSKDLDGRKKFTKLLLDKAAVVSCEEVPEAQRESWVLYLAKRKGVSLSESLRMTLCSLDPWSLELIDQELEKFNIGQSEDVILGGSSPNRSSDFFIDQFFRRNLHTALPCVSHFAGEPQSALPLLGLLGWNVRQMASLLADQKTGARNTKVSPFILEKLRAWMPFWTLDEVLALQEKLLEVDFNLKQKPYLPLGLWTLLVTQFCKEPS